MAKAPTMPAITAEEKYLKFPHMMLNVMIVGLLGLNGIAFLKYPMFMMVMEIL